MNSSVFFLISFALLGPIAAWDVLSPHDSSGQCANLYFQPGFNGTVLPLKDGEQLSDLSNIWHYLDKHNVGENGNVLQIHDGQQQVSEKDQQPISFEVRDRCKLMLSPRPYLKGGVQEFMGNVDNMTSDWLRPMSAGCECPKVCNCEEIRLRRSECARAYLMDDCTNCDSMFTSMTPGRKKRFPEKWSSEVNSIILKSGCSVSLEVFTALGKKTWKQLPASSGRLIQDIQALGNISRYECSCTTDSDPATNTSNRGSENDPPPLDIPSTKGSINTLLSKTHLKNHPGLWAALQSLRSRRSSKNAYILLLGMSGSGKSSSVNLLFDHPNITKTGDYVSTTRDIFEFTIPNPVEELGMNNTALHVIDTPGIGDTRGVAEDARFLASLEDFLNKHADLRRNLPNVVLIFSKFSDNRYDGIGSRFVNMLRTIDLFKDKIIDKNSTNVIFVLTHYMSETKEITRDPSERLRSIRKVIHEFSTLPRPIHIVLAENKPEESHLPSKNGFYQLPNGEYYPKNLFDRMQRNLIDNGDPVGEAVIRGVFSNPDNFPIFGKRHPLLHPSNAEVIKYLGVLSSFNKAISNTEVSIQLNKCFEELEPNLKTNYPSVLNDLQKVLYRKNIIEISDLPQTSEEILRLLDDVPINPVTLSLFSKAFNISIPHFDKRFIVGSGYSLVSDSVLPSSIFEVGNNFTETELLFRMPDNYAVTLRNQLDNNFQVFTDRDSFIQGRMEALGLPQDPLPQTTYAGSISEYPGFNLISLSDSEDSNEIYEWDRLTATMDYITFQIKLNENAKFSQSFVNAVKALHPLNSSDSVNVQAWNRFFKQYGTHVVTNAFGGGSITVKVEINNDNNTGLSNSKKFSVLSEVMGNVVKNLANELIGKDGSYVPPPGVNYEFSQRGGSAKHFWPNFSELDQVKNVDRWRESLRYDPIILKNRLQLLPISEVVKQAESGSEIGYMIEEAAANLLNASLVYIPVQTLNHNEGEGGNPRSRDKTVSGEVMGSRGGDFESMNEFAKMFQTLTESSKAMEAQLLQVVAGLAQKQQLLEEEWQSRNLLAMQQQQTELERQRREDQILAEQLKLKREEMEMQKAVLLAQDARLEQQRRDEIQIRREELEAQKRASDNAFQVQMASIKMQLEIHLKDIKTRMELADLSFTTAERDRNTGLIMRTKELDLQKTMHQSTLESQSQLTREGLDLERRGQDINLESQREYIKLQADMSSADIKSRGEHAILSFISSEKDRQLQKWSKSEDIRTKWMDMAGNIAGGLAGGLLMRG